MDLLSALGTFARVVETGSFSAVAREANTSHSTVTRLVGQLEEHFGVRLFHRTTRRLSLTEDGQDLLNHARRLAEVTQDMEGTFGRNRSAPTGPVRVGTPVGMAILMMARLPKLLQQYPGLAVELVVRDQFSDLVEERLDLAIRRGQPTDSAVVSRAIGNIGRVVVAAAPYLGKRGAPVHPRDLETHDCIIHTAEPDGTTWHFTGPDGPVEARVVGSFRADNSEMVHRAALAGYGIAMLPEAQVMDDLRAARLYRLLTGYASELRPVYVIYPSRRHLAPRTRVVIDFVIELGRAIETRVAEERLWGEHEGQWLT